MKRLPLNRILEKDHVGLIRRLVEDGGIFAYPTDTLYGLGGKFLSHRVVNGSG